MFRIGLKIPINNHNFNWIKKQRCERIYLRARYYKTDSNIKYKDSLFKDVRFISRLSGHNYSTKLSKSEKSHRGTRILFTLGSVTIGAIGILTYARNNSEFRKKLNEWIPGTDRVIKIMFQEELSYLDYILKFFESLKHKILNTWFAPGITKPGQVKTTVDCTNLENYKAPKPAFESTALQLSPNVSCQEKSNSEIQLNKIHKENIEIVTQKLTSSSVISNESLTADLLKLEKDAGDLSLKAIAEFKKAACAVQKYNKDVLNILESSNSIVEQKVWDRLKLAQEERTQASTEAEKKADEAVETLKQLYASIDHIEFVGTQGQKNIIKKNISNILSDVDDAKKEFDQEVSNANISEKYWKGVKAAREKFQDELKILIPNVNIEDKNLAVNNETFDLFVLYMYRKVAFLQKELQKMQTIADAKLKIALKSAGDQEKIQEAIVLEVSKETKKLQEGFEKKVLEEGKVLSDKNREQLKLQAQVYADLLKEALVVKDREMERKLNRLANEKDEEYAIKAKSEMARVIGKLRGIDEALEAYVEADKDADKARQMWAAIYGLVRALNSVQPGVLNEFSLRPLKNELLLVHKVSDDPFISNVIDAMPKEVFERGIYPDHVLRKRFYKVEKVARILAMIPEQGAPMWAYILSYLQSILMVRNNLILEVEAQKSTEINTVNTTFDILQKARYWMDQGSLELSMRYMTLLEGASRIVADNWIREVQMMLEIQQSIQAMMFYTTAKSLAFIDVNESKKDQKK